MLLQVARVLVSNTLASLIIFLSRWSVLSVCDSMSSASNTASCSSVIAGSSAVPDLCVLAAFSAPTLARCSRSAHASSGVMGRTSGTAPTSCCVPTAEPDSDAVPPAGPAASLDTRLVLLKLRAELVSSGTAAHSGERERERERDFPRREPSLPSSRVETACRTSRSVEEPRLRTLSTLRSASSRVRVTGPQGTSGPWLTPPPLPAASAILVGGSAESSSTRPCTSSPRSREKRARDALENLPLKRSLNVVPPPIKTEHMSFREPCLPDCSPRPAPSSTPTLSTRLR
mmetsp:Transcript_73756/g.196286  ORF Transcript_73756/g.196286 Transcript_73756/m.196286 type:complete len:287 (-) Transcript_73756:97-957(-)